ncbi:GAF and ANTAR domain-containing protein [Nocardioides sp. ChNu-99]|uniref:GAF and ANTAR domain-containing protein n=1 Tax=Nocardioides sp. ChNu-99 TaxID=2839897 RepID=UPI002406B567|nr:GAF and ANTAR domain-containing protein [Nocardioides sp. ChNu-99]MDF9716492.1 GAF and ANTAR domain-containing protein [Nocardioides sp. ChNu-99]
MSELISDPATFAKVAQELHTAEAVGGRNRDRGATAVGATADTTAEAIVARALSLIPGAEHVSLTLRVSGGYKSLAFTDETARQADALQYALREGPCLEATNEAGWVRSGDVGVDPRWPTWGPQVAQRAGVRSILALQLTHGDHLSGAINIFSDQAGHFADRELIDTACIYAMHASTALNSARLTSELRTALSSRHLIGMAQGRLIERLGLDPHSSFEYLRRLSSTHQLKLREVAEHVLADKPLPPPPGGPTH